MRKVILILSKNNVYPCLDSCDRLLHPVTAITIATMATNKHTPANIVGRTAASEIRKCIRRALFVVLMVVFQMIRLQIKPVFFCIVSFVQVH